MSAADGHEDLPGIAEGILRLADGSGEGDRSVTMPRWLKRALYPLFYRYGPSRCEECGADPEMDAPLRMPRSEVWRLHGAWHAGQVADRARKASELAQTWPYSRDDFMAALTAIGFRPKGDAILDAALQASVIGGGSLEGNTLDILDAMKAYSPPRRPAG